MPSNDVTLAFSLQALEELTRPTRAFDDAATWASHVGIVSSESSVIERQRVREAGYQQDFLSGPRSIEEALSRIRSHFETERYVFVGTDETGGVAETVPDWTFQSVNDAATAADWRLATTSSTGDDWL
jgi:DNA-binding response OmpR family regulator